MVYGIVLFISVAFRFLRSLTLLHPKKNSTLNLATANKRKTNTIDDECFQHPAKCSKNQASISKNTYNTEIDDKFESLSKISDDGVDMENEATKIPAGLKHQPGLHF